MSQKLISRKTCSVFAMIRCFKNTHYLVSNPSCQISYISFPSFFLPFWPSLLSPFLFSYWKRHKHTCHSSDRVSPQNVVRPMPATVFSSLKMLSSFLWINILTVLTRRRHGRSLFSHALLTLPFLFRKCFLVQPVEHVFRISWTLFSFPEWATGCSSRWMNI